METKALKVEIKQVTEEGEFEGYASTRDKDKGGDIVAEGAFTNTITQKGGKFPILFFHDPMRPIGLSVDMKEDGHGLYTKGQLDLDIEDGRRVHSGMKKGYIDRMSIGYRTIDSEWDPKSDSRILKEIDLLEYSMITKHFAMNENALVTGVKLWNPAETEIHTIVLAKNRFKTVDTAKTWLETRGFITDKMEDTEQAFKFFQKQGEVTLKDNVRSVRLGNGVHALVADVSADALLEDVLVQLKEGRVLSRRNMNLVQNAVEALQALLDAASDEESSGKGPDSGGQPNTKVSPELLQSAKELLAVSKLFS